MNKDKLFYNAPIITTHYHYGKETIALFLGMDCKGKAMVYVEGRIDCDNIDFYSIRLPTIKESPFNTWLVPLESNERYGPTELEKYTRLIRYHYDTVEILQVGEISNFGWCDSEAVMLLKDFKYD